jgi:ribose/xylose/arabinose/galactoside ABC-type transport system permease subunit
MTSMTAVNGTTPAARTPIIFVPLVLGLLMLVVYSFLPFINHTDSELGNLTISQVMEERSYRTIPVFDADGEPLLDESDRPVEYKIESNGLLMLMLAGAAGALLGVWNLVDPRVDRTVSVLLAFIGFIALSYYMIFAESYIDQSATYLGRMGPAFWAPLIIGILMILQGMIPHAKALPHFRVSRMLGNQEAVLLFGIALLLIVVGVVNPRFLAERNLLDILQGNAYIAVAAIGMSVVIITGNIDISVGSLIALLAVISGRLVVSDVPILISWLAPVVLGVAIGALIGAMVAYLRVPSIVVTLAMLSILKGILIIWTSGKRVTDMPDDYFLAQWKPLGVSTPIWFMIILTILAFIWLRYSKLGRSFYAVGGNSEAARLSGLSEQKIVLQAFMVNGFFAGIASLLYATQFQIIQVTPPPFLELNVITASVVGGISILGGTGTVLGAMFAAILLNMIRSGMVFINVDPFWLKSVQGLLILITVLADILRRRRQRT